MIIDAYTHSFHINGNSFEARNKIDFNRTFRMLAETSCDSAAPFHTGLTVYIDRSSQSSCNDIICSSVDTKLHASHALQATMVETHLQKET